MTKFTGITREAGESEADYQRRYNREKQRSYRADKPKSPKVRGKNLKPAKNSPLSGEEWAASQQRPDESDDEFRRRSARERTARYRGVHAERLKVERLQHYAENKDAILEAVAVRKAAKPEVYKAQSRRHFEKYRDAKLAKLKQWGDENPDRLQAAKDRHRLENPGLYASYSASWRKAARAAIPVWVDHDAIKALHDEAARLSAETGIKHNVDHIVPLQNDLVCGLHVHTNMRVIPATENFKKRNKIDHALIEAVMRAHIEALSGGE